MDHRSGKAVDQHGYQRYRAPQEDGQALIEPAWHALPQLVAANRRMLDALSLDFEGRSLSELRRLARAELLGDAHSQAGPLILTGHQPELFHPGVWLKNLAAGRLAERMRGLGVNLVIDSDLCRSTSLRVPAGPATTPRVESIPYDAPCRPLPYEERRVVDPSVLEGFPSYVSAALAGLIDRPLVEDWWPQVLQAAAEFDNLGRAIADARAQLESRWGVTNFQAPASRVCDGAAFQRFAVCLLRRLDELQSAYNGALAEYRAAHHLRSPAQPMPDLHRQHDWLESPLWVWTTADPTRRPLYAKRTGGALLLSDLSGGSWRVDLERDPAEQLAALREEQGVKLRSRALITTLYARLVLGDLFVHGIGGAKYDQVADRLAERFFGLAPPPHATLSATLRLPIAHERFDAEAPRRLAAELRELEFHPEKFLAGDPAAAGATAKKERWVATAKTPGNAAERHQSIVEANEAMGELLLHKRQSLLAEQRSMSDKQRSAAVLESREYGFCLYPEEWLRERLLGMLP